jgi:hypothetical protein
MAEHLASLSWSSNHSVSAGSYYSSYREMSKFDLDVAKGFLRTTLAHEKYELFGKALGWLKNQLPTLAMPLFEMVGSAALSDSVDFGKVKDRYVLSSHSNGRLLMPCSLLQVLSTTSLLERKDLLTAIAKPGDATCRACVRNWLAQEVIPQAVTACLGQEVTLTDGRAIVEMISEYQDLEFFTAR